MANATDVSIQIDPVLFRSLSAPDALFVKGLHDRSDEELLKHLGITTNRNGMAVGQFQRKRVVFHGAYKLDGKPRHVLVYNPTLRAWPGSQPETVVICDATWRPLHWAEVGGSPIFEKAALNLDDPQAPVLLLTRKHRHVVPNPERGTYSYSLAGDKVALRPEIEWLYKNDAQRAFYDRVRKAIRERSEN